ncbi:MAG: hypothetical protein RIB30_05180 [Thalassospira sp.]|uniref:hypothetical protein n=1 Tax=Thalassospira sp. TaxID=1912094 RepID=UPI0032EE8B37
MSKQEPAISNLDDADLDNALLKVTRLLLPWKAEQLDIMGGKKAESSQSADILPFRKDD